MASPSPQPLPAVQSAGDYQALARQRLVPGTWQYLADGDSLANAQALAGVSLLPRPLRDLRGGHTRLTLFGQPLDHPVLLAPVAYQRLFHPDGEVASAMAAGAQGGQMLVSSLASMPFDQIAGAAAQVSTQGLWFQLYWQGNRDRTARLLQRALAAGFGTVVLTVDAPVKRAMLQLPDGIHAVNLEPALPLPGGASVVFGGWMTQAPTWADLAWLRGQTTLPLLVKGLMHADDAQAAIDAGCDGIVVSNHGGRVLPGTPSSLSALDAIARRSGGRVPVLFDSGIRSGRDVFVALAHGATAVLLGRPYLWGLAAGGAMGVAHVLRLLRDELELTMALTGCADLADIASHGVDH
jgi:4-hydroxymandelate oxidase